MSKVSSSVCDKCRRHTEMGDFVLYINLSAISYEVAYQYFFVFSFIMQRNVIVSTSRIPATYIENPIREIFELLFALKPFWFVEQAD
jgi:hypothetical protein